MWQLIELFCFFSDDLQMWTAQTFFFSHTEYLMNIHMYMLTVNYPLKWVSDNLPTKSQRKKHKLTPRRLFVPKWANLNYSSDSAINSYAQLAQLV